MLEDDAVEAINKTEHVPPDDRAPKPAARPRRERARAASSSGAAERGAVGYHAVEQLAAGGQALSIARRVTVTVIAAMPVGPS
jgi:hypothetical protein